MVIDSKPGVMSNDLYSSDDELELRKNLYKLFSETPVPPAQIMSNLGLFFDSKILSRILYMNFIYEKILSTQGVVMEFGTNWGQNTSLFSLLRSIYEPFNRHRKIIGFDTFSGFPNIDKKDGNSNLMKKGNLTLPDGYADYLSKILENQEKLNPLSHIKKHELCVGDASVELEKYLKREPHTIIALAYFDFDIYEPTKKCLELIKDRITKGTVLAFDELNDPDSPGETTALKEVFGLQNISLRKYQYCSRVSYFILE